MDGRGPPCGENKGAYITPFDHRPPSVRRGRHVPHRPRYTTPGYAGSSGQIHGDPLEPYEGPASGAGRPCRLSASPGNHPQHVAPAAPSPAPTELRPALAAALAGPRKTGSKAEAAFQRGLPP
ncbi:hypothetical protein ACE1SV_73800 [Streptomyces sp. E-15]